LETRSIAHKFSTSLEVSGEPTPELLDALSRVMKGNPPIVFINGTAKADPTLEDILVQYQDTK
jgi:hypothetical protein